LNGMAHERIPHFWVFQISKDFRRGMCVAGYSYPALVGFICLETDSTTPISASCMARAVPP